jgi:chromosome partitioning protein
MAAMSVNLRHGRRSGITEGAAPLHPTQTDPRNKALLVQNSGTVRVTSQVFCFLCALFSPYRLFSAAFTRREVTMPSRRPKRIVVVASPKGGTGKSTFATNLLVAARLDGIDAVGIDLDGQRSLTSWGEDRASIGRRPEVRVVASRFSDWEDTLASVHALPLAVIDCPPGLDDRGAMHDIRDLMRVSHLVLMPCLPQGPTLRKVGDFGHAIRATMGVDVIFLLNQVIAGRALLPDARRFLAERGELAPIEVPMREDVHRATDVGMASVEDARLGAHGAMRQVWQFVARRLSLATQEAA